MVCYCIIIFLAKHLDLLQTYSLEELMFVILKSSFATKPLNMSQRQHSHYMNYHHGIHWIPFNSSCLLDLFAAFVEKTW